MTVYFLVLHCKGDTVPVLSTHIPAPWGDDECQSRKAATRQHVFKDDQAVQWRYNTYEFTTAVEDDWLLKLQVYTGGSSSGMVVSPMGASLE